MSAIRAVIFDFDGVIVDTESPVYESWCVAFAEHGCPPLTLDEWAREVGTVGALDVLGLLHERATRPIDEDTMRSALRIGRYLFEHMLIALSAPDPITRRALAWLTKQEADTVSQRDGPGLVHGSDGPGRPRTPNARASHCRATGRRRLRTTGHKGLPPRTRHRHGAWARLPRPPTAVQGRAAVCHTSPEAWTQARPRVAAHRQRFRGPRRSLRPLQAPGHPLRQRWPALQATGTG